MDRLSAACRTGMWGSHGDLSRSGHRERCSARTMPAYAVATVGEIPEGGRKVVEVAGRSIGVFNLDGAYFAIRNRCPIRVGRSVRAC